MTNNTVNSLKGLNLCHPHLDNAYVNLKYFAAFLYGVMCLKVKFGGDENLLDVLT